MSVKTFDARPLEAGADVPKLNDRAKVSLRTLNLSKHKKLILIIGGVALLALAGFYFWGNRSSAPVYMTARVDRGNLRNTVTATGTLQAVTTVQVGSQASGIISALYADFNSIVKKGQVVAQLDPAVSKAQVDQSRAALQQAQASLQLARAGQGAQASVAAQIESIGTNLLFVSAGAQNVGGVRSGAGDTGTNTLTIEDLNAIKREVPSVSMLTPAVNARSQLVSGNANSNTSVQGVSEQYPDVRKWNVQSGEFFTDADVKTAARVIVIGQTTADNLFPGMDPVGQTLRVMNLPFRVSGVMARKGQPTGTRSGRHSLCSVHDGAKKDSGQPAPANSLRLGNFAGRHVHCPVTNYRPASAAPQTGRQRTRRLYGAQHDGHR